jgi:hypothetical protein
MADLCWTGYVGDQPCNAIGKSCKDCRCERLCRCMLVTGLQQGVALHLGCFNEALIRTIRTSMVLATACNCASCSKPSLNGLRTTLQCFPYLAYMLAGVPRHVNTLKIYSQSQPWTWWTLIITPSSQISRSCLTATTAANANDPLYSR